VYFNMNGAADEIAARKWGLVGIYAPNCYDISKANVSDNLIDITKACCNDVYAIYGRFQKCRDARFIPVLMPVHHLDLEFYDRFLPEYFDEMDRAHMALWHPDLQE